MSICTSSEDCSGGSTLEKEGKGRESEGEREEREVGKQTGKEKGMEGDEGWEGKNSRRGVKRRMKRK